jgi:hypothetical protein
MKALLVTDVRMEEELIGKGITIKTTVKRVGGNG